MGENEQGRRNRGRRGGIGGRRWRGRRWRRRWRRRRRRKRRNDRVWKWLNEVIKVNESGILVEAHPNDEAKFTQN